jgi:ornithine cyclodeaminase/alanine dehydrogenase-like protein (mu-crystallin family)
MTASKICLLNAHDVHKLLPMQRCIALMEQALRLVTDERTWQPLRNAHAVPGTKGFLGLMPGSTPDPAWFGIKVVSVFPGNFGTAYGSHQGMVLLFEPEHGAPCAIVDARAITAIRTAAASAVATRALADPAASTLGIFGYGEQAESHLEALGHTRRFERIRVWGRDAARCLKFAAAQSARLGLEVEPVTELEDAAEADIVCTVTAAREPFFRASWLRPGQHLNVVGSSIPSTAEVDNETVARSRFFVDYRDSALALAGEFRRAKAAGLIDDSHILGSVGDVLTGKVPGRRSAQDVTLFKSLGMAAEDLVSADFVLAEARRQGIGQWVEW